MIYATYQKGEFLSLIEQTNESKTKIATNLIDKKEKISKLKIIFVSVTSSYNFAS
jgi:hypothetical protein